MKITSLVAFLLIVTTFNTVEGCLDIAVSKNVFIGNSEHRIFCTNVPERSPIGTVACEFLASHVKDLQLANIGELNITNYIQLSLIGGSDKIVQFIIARPVTDIMDSQQPHIFLDGRLQCRTTTGFTRENKFTMIFKEENNRIPKFEYNYYSIDAHEKSDVGEDIVNTILNNKRITATDEDNSPNPTSSNIIRFELMEESDIFQVVTMENNSDQYPKSYHASIHLKTHLNSTLASKHFLTLKAQNLDDTRISWTKVEINVLPHVQPVLSNISYNSSKHEEHSEASEAAFENVTTTEQIISKTDVDYYTEEPEYDATSTTGDSISTTERNAPKTNISIETHPDGKKEIQFSGDGEDYNNVTENENHNEFEESDENEDDDDGDEPSGNWHATYEFYQ